MMPDVGEEAVAARKPMAVPDMSRSRASHSIADVVPPSTELGRPACVGSRDRADEAWAAGCR